MIHEGTETTTVKRRLSCGTRNVYVNYKSRRVHIIMKYMEYTTQYTRSRHLSLYGRIQRIQWAEQGWKRIGSKEDA